MAEGKTSYELSWKVKVTIEKKKNVPGRTLLCLAGTTRRKPNGTTIVAGQDWVIARDSPSLTSSPRGRLVGQDDDINSISALGPFFHVVRCIRHVVHVAASTASVRLNSML